MDGEGWSDDDGGEGGGTGKSWLDEAPGAACEGHGYRFLRHYPRVQKIGEGAYAEVSLHASLSVSNGDHVPPQLAVKRTRLGPFQEGVNKAAVRELWALQTNEANGAEDEDEGKENRDRASALPRLHAAFVVKGRLHLAVDKARLDAESLLISLWQHWASTAELMRLANRAMQLEASKAGSTDHSGGNAGSSSLTALLLQTETLLQASRPPLFSFALARALASRMLQSLNHCHRGLGMLHQDTKPGNLLLLLPQRSGQQQSEGEGKGRGGRRRLAALSDFGMAVSNPNPLAVGSGGSVNAAIVDASVAGDVIKGRLSQQKQQQVSGESSSSLRKEEEANSDEDDMLDWDDDEDEEKKAAEAARTSRWEGGLFHQVATVPYRAPELLFGSRRLTKGAEGLAAEGEAADTWAAGCVLAELLRTAFISTRVSTAALQDFAASIELHTSPALAAEEEEEVPAMASDQSYQGVAGVGVGEGGADTALILQNQPGGAAAAAAAAAAGLPVASPSIIGPSVSALQDAATSTTVMNHAAGATAATRAQMPLSTMLSLPSAVPSHARHRSALPGGLASAAAAGSGSSSMGQGQYPPSVLMTVGGPNNHHYSRAPPSVSSAVSSLGVSRLQLMTGFGKAEQPSSSSSSGRAGRQRGRRGELSAGIMEEDGNEEDEDGGEGEGEGPAKGAVINSVSSAVVTGFKRRRNKAGIDSTSDNDDEEEDGEDDEGEGNSGSGKEPLDESNDAAQQSAGAGASNKPSKKKGYAVRSGGTDGPNAAAGNSTGGPTKRLKLFDGPSQEEEQEGDKEDDDAASGQGESGAATTASRQTEAAASAGARRKPVVETSGDSKHLKRSNAFFETWPETAGKPPPQNEGAASNANESGKPALSSGSSGFFLRVPKPAAASAGRALESGSEDSDGDDASGSGGGRGRWSGLGGRRRGAISSAREQHALPYQQACYELFPGNSELGVLAGMSSLLGAPNSAVWPAFKELPGYLPLNNTCEACLADKKSAPCRSMGRHTCASERLQKWLTETGPFAPAGAKDEKDLGSAGEIEAGLASVLPMLSYDPSARPSAERCLQELPFFKQASRPGSSSSPSSSSSSASALAGANDDNNDDDDDALWDQLTALAEWHEQGQARAKQLEALRKKLQKMTKSLERGGFDRAGRGRGGGARGRGRVSGFSEAAGGGFSSSSDDSGLQEGKRPLMGRNLFGGGGSGGPAFDGNDSDGDDEL